jgi:hypothetical protein
MVKGSRIETTVDRDVLCGNQKCSRCSVLDNKSEDIHPFKGMTKRQPKPRTESEPGRIGRPPKADAKMERSLVRHNVEEHAIYQAEAERLTRITGQGWTVSGYLRVAGVAYAGKHLAEGQASSTAPRSERPRRGGGRP